MFKTGLHDRTFVPLSSLYLQLDCGHRCHQICHSGLCNKKCTKKVVVRCPCRRLRKEWFCNEQREVLCDNKCLLALQEQKENEERAVAEEIASREREEREAMASLERQLRPRKRKPRPLKAVIDPQPRRRQHLKITVGLLLSTLFMLYTIYYIL